jgi:hypothetical protein
MAQLQHNMWVVASRTAVLSVITGGGKWVEITTHADPLYQYLILTAERKFWRRVESGEPPRLFGVEPPKPRIQAFRIVDMSGSNAWGEFAGIFARIGSWQCLPAYERRGMLAFKRADRGIARPDWHLIGNSLGREIWVRFVKAGLCHRLFTWP